MIKEIVPIFSKPNIFPLFGMSQQPLSATSFQSQVIQWQTFKTENLFFTL